MDLLSNFLDAFKKRIKDPRVFKNNIAQIISDVVGFEVPSENIEIKSGTIFVSGSSYIKQALFQQKETILQKLKESPTAENKIFDIR